MVELTLEEGRTAGTKVFYVAKVLAIMEDGKLNLSFLRIKTLFSSKDTFVFPTNTDEGAVERGQCKGVLVTVQAATKRQADLVRVSPPLIAFNMH